MCDNTMHTIFEDVMDPGITLYELKGFWIPDYLIIDAVVDLTIDDHLDPSRLAPSTLYVYNDNIYLTDETGNIAFIDCRLVQTSPTAPIRAKHPEYKAVSLHGHDAGHFGLSLGQHPSFAMEQDSYMNRYGIWRIFERYWTSVLKDGCSVRIIGVFVEGEDTFSPYWCIHEEIDGEVGEYVFTNDGDQ